MMLSKIVDIEVDIKSWKKKPRPAWIKALPPTNSQSVDVAHALLLLGSMTTPSGLSEGSPERYWACIRYFSACADSSDLRVRTPFTGLDPHQKGILSDDFGVAISTAWLKDRMGGVRDIIDGRQFMINMGIRRKKEKRLPKVGPSKCPDFVLEDKQGLFHVLECKGTQSNMGYLRGAMLTGMAQKRGIKVDKALRGDSLVIGLLLASETSKHRSKLVVVDPEIKPLTVVERSEERKAREVMARLRMARALNLTGFPQMAFEIALPQDLDTDSAEVGLMTVVERRMLAIGHESRRNLLQKEIDSEFRTADNRIEGGYVVQQMQFELPAITLDSGEVARRVTVRRGVRSDVIATLADASEQMHNAAMDRAEVFAKQEEVHTNIGQHIARLEYPELCFSELVFD